MEHSPEFLKIVNESKSRIKQIDIAGYLKMRQEGTPHLLIDIREESEFAAGHVAGAMYIGKGVIERDIERKAPDPNTTLVLYCGGGFRSALSADALQQMGYKNVISLDGGWRALQSSGLPLEK